MANIPQPPEEEKEDEETEQSDDKQEKEKNGTDNANEMDEEAGSPIVNEVEEMDADAN